MTNPDLRSIDIRQIRYFLTLAEELNFRRASERLHITQPPLSRQIKLLEASLGVALFERDTQRVALTSRGSQAVVAFTRALRAWERAFADVAASAAERSGSLSTLRLGLPWWADAQAVPKLEAKLRRAKLIERLVAKMSNGPACVDDVLGGKLDAALVVLPLKCATLVVRTFGTLPMIAAFPAKSALARRKQVPLHALAEFDTFFMFNREGNPLMFDHLRARYQALGFRPRQIVHSNDAMATHAQIAAGLGTTLIPANMTQNAQPGIALRPLTKDSQVNLPLAIIAHPTFSIEWVERLLREAPRLVKLG